MLLRNSISERVAEIRDWRRDLHQHRLGYEDPNCRYCGR